MLHDLVQLLYCHLHWHCDCWPQQSLLAGQTHPAHHPSLHQLSLAAAGGASGGALVEVHLSGTGQRRASRGACGQGEWSGGQRSQSVGPPGACAGQSARCGYAGMLSDTCGPRHARHSPWEYLQAAHNSSPAGSSGGCLKELMETHNISRWSIDQAGIVIIYHYGCHSNCKLGSELHNTYKQTTSDARYTCFQPLHEVGLVCPAVVKGAVSCSPVASCCCQLQLLMLGQSCILVHLQWKQCSVCVCV